MTSETDALSAGGAEAVKPSPEPLSDAPILTHPRAQNSALTLGLTPTVLNSTLWA
jgi:hypothetical protein